MNIDMLTNPSVMITVVSFVTFIGIIWWTYVSHKPADFKQAEMLPFADGDIGQPAPVIAQRTGASKEARHG